MREPVFDAAALPQTESVFALSNGHIGMRGNLDEGEPHALPGTYLNSVYELRQLPHAEVGYGYPDSGQTVINVTNGKLIRLLVDDEPFDVRYGELRSHERMLSLRDGVLRRSVEWTSPVGRTVSVVSTRLVSLSQRSIAAICYEVTPIDRATRVVVQSELVANEQLPGAGNDPRASAVLTTPLVAEQRDLRETRALLVHSTRRSGLRIGAAMDHVLTAPGEVWTGLNGDADNARFTATIRLEPGQSLRLVKFLAYGWSSQRSLPAIRAQVEAALVSARATGWDGLVTQQREFLDEFWAQADVDLDGDPEVQQAVRFSLFQVLQASARAERRPVAAKGLTGPGYDGHAFWDTETFVLPMLTYTDPDAASDALRWRHMILPEARERARQLQLAGAAFPWRTITGPECSGYWPAGTAAFHINADIADAAIRFVDATGDVEFERQIGIELLVETARLWHSLGFHTADGGFRIDGVTGPDEYSAIVDNNIYTNVMAQRNLWGAVEAVRRHPDRAAELGVSFQEVLGWQQAADAMMVPYDEARGVHPQSEGFTDHQEWDFAATPDDHYPLLLHYPYHDLYRKQVTKQADLVLALHLRGDAFTPEQKARDFAYYERLTVRDSSLSACTQAVIAAEVGQLDLAYDYLGEAARMDLDNLEHTSGNGLHLASLAGAWIALVAGFGGMRDHGGRLTFAPRLPEALSRLTFTLCWRGLRVRVEITPTEATYQLVDKYQGKTNGNGCWSSVSGTSGTGGMGGTSGGSGLGDEDGEESVELRHHGMAFTVVPGVPVVHAIPPIEPGPRPTQPPGREPATRHVPSRHPKP